MRRRPWGPAALWALGCSLLFVGVYAGCNGLAAGRSELGTIQFGWERRLPFVAWTILPYWSIDGFFVASFFFCRDRAGLRRLGGRIAAAILAGGVCFLLFPLQSGWPRSSVEEFWRPFYTALWALDRPYNQVPSLHIALLAILAEHYARVSKGILRAILLGWFLLVGLSTLLTGQHHVLDAAGGLVLGLVCLHLVGSSSPPPTSRNPRIGVYYLLGSLTGLALSTLGNPFGLLLLWPA
ncbi:MAG TPA: phosphatase PAP2 family protein, partial [Planctomycetota bacterium]|nr:phosphatase PAP2 family protein [Planctomycetota bacterium]